MNGFSATVLRNSAFGLAAQMAMKVLSFTFNVLVIRQLGATDYGQYTAVGAFGTLFLFIADLGLSPYAVREFARWRDTADGAARSQNLFSKSLSLNFALMPADDGASEVQQPKITGSLLLPPDQQATEAIDP
jgi:O-antigen/teichoic acid export membrane protein